MTAKTATAAPAKKTTARKPAAKKPEPKTAALPKGVSVKVSKVRTGVYVGETTLAAYFKTADLAKMKLAVNAEGLRETGRTTVAGLHDAWFKNEHLTAIRAALATL